LALLICVWRFCRSLALPEGLATLFYGVNLLQRVVIPQQRTMYYYYYPYTIFSCVAFAIVLGSTRERRGLGMRPIVIILVMASVFFLYCYPRMAALEASYDCALGCWN
jgi:dolichyl-phosphate-mannose--protein O-mannosyl transferase